MAQVLPEPEALPMWVIYDKPTDYPNCFVARLWQIFPGRQVATDSVIVGNRLSDVRSVLPSGLVRLDRLPTDEPHIVEVWL